MERSVNCAKCKIKSSNLSNLRKHVKTFHPLEQAYLSSLQKRNRIKYDFSCHHCHKNFTHLRNLRFHMKIHGYSETDSQNKAVNNNQNCALCEYTCNKKGILNHYREVHDIAISQRSILFTTNEEFTNWKKNLESETKCRFIRESSKSCKTHIYTSFICHRSGRFAPEGKNLRQLKKGGSIKINSFCPASIKLKRNIDGKCEVCITETHVGHGKESELSQLPLTLQTSFTENSPDFAINVGRTGTILTEDTCLDSKLSESCFEREKEKVKNALLELSVKVTLMETQAELDVVKECIAPLLTL